jgi:DNA-binding beta-propeller fold protein YncE
LTIEQDSLQLPKIKNDLTLSARNAKYNPNASRYSRKEGGGMKGLSVGVSLVALVGALEVGARVLDKRAVVEAVGAQAPRFEVDPMWPKPLPNHWVIGTAIGVSIDAQDHVWIVHRAGSLEPREVWATTNPPNTSCCFPAPPVLEFDQAGTLIGHWGGPGPGYDWPESNHGITIDYKGNVWIGGSGAKDMQVLKFTPDGKFLMQIGKPGRSKGSNDVENLNKPTKPFVDQTTNELYVSDGYGNHRVIVYDADTGKYKRHWGAYGNKPDDSDLGKYDPDAPPAQQFRSAVHCADLSKDGLLYVCDRLNDRLQVFKPDGTFVKEAFIAKRTLGDGSVWDIAFSKDPQQKYIYLADGNNQKVYILLRESLEVLTSFGDGGRQPGQFYGVHSIATDSKGNIFTTETFRGQRVQKFTYKGIGPVAKDQGTVWPKTQSR